ncbi:MAG: hypothetical protein V8S87_00560 [Oscillospiraceae bacterium]
MESISKVLATSFGGYSLEHILSAVITLLVCLLAVRHHARGRKAHGAQ